MDGFYHGEEWIERDYLWNEIDLFSFFDLCFQIKNYQGNFPHLFTERKNVFCFKKKGILIASFTVKPVSFYGEQKHFRGLGIGSVSVHPRVQNQGLAFSMLSFFLNHQQNVQNEYDFLFLFGTPKGLYEKLGFSLVEEAPFITWTQAKGVQGSLLGVSSLEEKKTENLSMIEAQEIWSFVTRHSLPGESLLSFLEFLPVLQVKEMKIFISRSEDKNLSALSFFQKGDDFLNVVHGVSGRSSEEIETHLTAVRGVLGFDYDVFLPRQMLPNLARKPYSSLYIKSNNHAIIPSFEVGKLSFRSFQSI